MLKTSHRFIDPWLLTTAQMYPPAKDGPNCDLTKHGREPQMGKNPLLKEMPLLTIDKDKNAGLRGPV